MADSDPASPVGGPRSELDLAFESGMGGIPSAELPSQELMGFPSEDLLAPPIDLDSEDDEEPPPAPRTPLQEALQDPDGGSLAGQRIGNYEVSRVLARGGQGIVLEARHVALEHPLALKVLDPDAHPEAIARLRQEAKVLVRLKHPNLPTVNDLGDDQGVFFLAMEYVEGRDLEVIVSETGLPTWRWSARILEPIAEALQFCHESGVVHRDVKPPNIVIERGTERPVLVDFGLVKRNPNQEGMAGMESLALSRSRDIKGSPEFMPPEQAEPKGMFGGIGPGADVHALGATLYYLLTGRPPYRGENTWDVLSDIVSKPPQPPSELNPEIPRVLERLCLKALSKAQDMRPSAAEFAQILGQALALTESQEAEQARRPVAPKRRRSRLPTGGLKSLPMDSTEEVEPLAASGRRRRGRPAPGNTAGEGLSPNWVALGALCLLLAGMAGAAVAQLWAVSAVFAVGAVLGVVVLVAGRKPAAASPPPRLRRSRPFESSRPSASSRPTESKRKRRAHGAPSDSVVALSNATTHIRGPGEERPTLSEADAFALRGAERFRSGDYTTAIGDFSEAIRLRPDDAEAYSNRGAAYYMLKDYAPAIADFSACLRLDPDNPETYARRGRAFFKQREFAAAISDFSEVIQRDPVNADAYSKRGVAYIRQGDEERGRADEARAEQLRASAAETADDVST